MNLNELRDRAYKTACEKGWYDKSESDEHYLMMVIVELSEAIQADRANKRTNRKDYEERIECRDWNVHDFEHCIEGTVECELVDVCLRLLSFEIGRAHV